MNSQDAPEYEGNESNQALSDQLYMVRLEKLHATATIGGEPTDIFLTGEIVFEGQLENENDLILTGLRYIAWWGESMDILGGLPSFAGPNEPVDFKSGPAGEIAPLDLRIHYPRLDKELKPACIESDAVYSVQEILRGGLKWEPAPPKDKGRDLILTVSVNEPVETPLGVIQSIGFESVALPIQPVILEEPKSPTHRSLAGCDPLPASSMAALLVTYPQRALHVRFICRDPFPAGETQATLDALAQNLISAACKVWWRKAGIMIEPDSGQVIKNTNLPTDPLTLADEAAISSNSQFTNAIEIYLVGGLQGSSTQPRRGGGVTYNCGSSTAYIVLEINKVRNNPQEFSHEIGHVLRLSHPSSVIGQNDACTLPASCQGSECSVMVPDRPTSSRNTKKNADIAQIANLGPALTPILDAANNPRSRVCDPDSPEQGFFHIVRDFPSDDGTEPSVPTLPAAVWWTHSDVWTSDHTSAGVPLTPAPPPNPNELYDGGLPMFKADLSPEHRSPVRVLDNVFCVRLHTCQEMVQPANVHLFLANPGASSQHLKRLTPTAGLLFRNAGLDRVLPGTPFTKSVLVPSADLTGFPAHSCVFAVVVSANAPNSALDAIISNPNSTFFSLSSWVAGDNDVAQRNLDIQETASGSSMLAWVETSNPLEGPASASVEVDTSEATGLKGLMLELDEKEWGNLEIGKTLKVDLADILQPGEHMILRFRATLPSGLDNGTTFPIHLKFFAGDQFISGYTHVLRVAPLSAAVFQVLDLLSSTLQDVAVGCRVDHARVLAESVRRIALIERQSAASSGCFGLLWNIIKPKNAWRSRLTNMQKEIFALSNELNRSSEPRIQVVGQKLAPLSEILSTSKNMDDHILIEAVREHLDRAAQLAGRLAIEELGI